MCGGGVCGGGGVCCCMCDGCVVCGCTCGGGVVCGCAVVDGLLAGGVPWTIGTPSVDGAPWTIGTPFAGIIGTAISGRMLRCSSSCSSLAAVVFKGCPQDPQKRT